MGIFGGKGTGAEKQDGQEKKKYTVTEGWQLLDDSGRPVFGDPVPDTESRSFGEKAGAVFRTVLSLGASAALFAYAVSEFVKIFF